MRSSRTPPDPDGPTFFLDRGLGKYHVSEVISSAGFAVLLMADLFPDDGQLVDDDTWIADVSHRGWVALTKDAAIARNHSAALRSSTLRVFALPNANLTGPEMAARFEANLNRIVQRARKAGPYVDIVHPDRLERRWPRKAKP